MWLQNCVTLLNYNKKYKTEEHFSTTKAVIYKLLTVIIAVGISYYYLYNIIIKLKKLFSTMVLIFKYSIFFFFWETQKLFIIIGVISKWDV